MFDFLKRFKAAEHTGAFEKYEGVNIDGTFIGNVLVNVLSGEKVPQVTYTLNINGRGSLVVNEQEFRDLTMAMVLMAEVRSPGYLSPLEQQKLAARRPEEQAMPQGEF